MQPGRVNQRAARSCAWHGAGGEAPDAGSAWLIDSVCALKASGAPWHACIPTRLLAPQAAQLALRLRDSSLGAALVARGAAGPEPGSEAPGAAPALGGDAPGAPRPPTVPLFAVSCVTGAALPLLHAFLFALRPTRGAGGPGAPGTGRRGPGAGAAQPPAGQPGGTLASAAVPPGRLGPGPACPPHGQRSVCAKGLEAGAHAGGAGGEARAPPAPKGRGALARALAVAAAGGSRPGSPCSPTSSSSSSSGLGSASGEASPASPSCGSERGASHAGGGGGGEPARAWAEAAHALPRPAPAAGGCEGLDSRLGALEPCAAAACDASAPCLAATAPHGPAAAGCAGSPGVTAAGADAAAPAHFQARPGACSAHAGPVAGCRGSRFRQLQLFRVCAI